MESENLSFIDVTVMVAVPALFAVNTILSTSTTFLSLVVNLNGFVLLYEYGIRCAQIPKSSPISISIVSSHATFMPVY